MFDLDKIKEAIKNAEELQSSNGARTYEVSALTSLRIRHLLNNIGALGTRYLEVGVHKGGTFCASVRGNTNLISAIAIDSFESDMDQVEKAEPIFLQNVREHCPVTTKFKLTTGDSFKIALDGILKPVDIYLYDGDHSEDSQRKALTYYLPVLADEFIFLCDDYDWPEVGKGTQDGIKECGLEILFEHTFKGNDHDNDGWWNGFYVAILKKKS